MLVFFCVVSSVITSLLWFIDFTNKICAEVNRVWSSLEGKKTLMLLTLRASVAHGDMLMRTCFDWATHVSDSG